MPEFERIRKIELIVRSYDSVKNGRVCSDFLGNIGLDSQGFTWFDEANREQAFSESLRLFYENNVRRSVDYHEHKAIGEISATFSLPLHLSYATWSVITNHFYQTNAEVSRRFGLDALIEVDPPPIEHRYTIDSIFSNELLAIVDTISSLQKRLERIEAALSRAQT